MKPDGRYDDVSIAQLGERQTEVFSVQITAIVVSGGPVFKPQSGQFFFFFPGTMALE
jgi:hypothetical protein